MTSDTLDSLLRIFGWSCNVMLSGQTPFVDWNNRALEGGGQDLAAGFRACLCQIRGDWSFYKEVFYFPQWNQSDMMCPFCRASSVDMHRCWTNVAQDAGWRATRWTHETYIRHRLAAGLAIPVLFLVVLGLRLECVT
eukprot:4873305-Pyramimonas_sp.AAC.1